MTHSIKTLLILISLVLVAAGCSGSGGDAKKEGGKKQAVPVTAAPAVQKTMPVELRAIGNVEPFAAVAVKAKIGGELQAVHFRQGQEVKKGQLLFTIDPRPYEAALHSAEANLAKTGAELENARRQVQRYGSVTDKGVVSAEQLDQVRTSAAAMEASVQAGQAAVATARLDLDYCTIRSPVDGVTGDLKADPGNLIKADADTPMVTINQVHPIRVAFALPERDLPAVRRAMAAGPLPVRVLVPGGGEAPQDGKLAFIDNTVDPATGTIRLKAEFPNAETRLWPGQFVNVVVVTGAEPGVVVVPGQAVQTGQKGQYVYVVKADQTVELRPVVPGLSEGGEVVIREGLRPGEQVVTDGQLRLVPGAAITLVDPGKGGQDRQP